MALYFYLEFREIQDIYLNLYITSAKRARESRMLHHSMIYADYSIALTRITSQFAWYLRYFRRNTSTALLIPRTDLHKWGSWITANARWIVINKRYKHGGNIRLTPSGLCNFIFQDTLSCNLDSLRRLFNSLVQCQDNKVFYYINIYVIRVISRTCDRELCYYRTLLCPSGATFVRRVLFVWKDVRAPLIVTVNLESRCERSCDECNTSRKWYKNLNYEYI